MALTPKREAFCQAIVAGMNQSDAYRKAYDAAKMKAETIQNKAHVLMKNGEIRARIEEIRAPVVAELQYGLKQAMEEAEDAYRVAKLKENGGAMVAAVTLRAKLNGLLIEKREDVTDPLKKAIGNMPAEKAQEMLDALNQVEAIRKKSAA